MRRQAAREGEQTEKRGTHEDGPPASHSHTRPAWSTGVQPLSPRTPQRLIDCS
jgi:hypothetical protein